jgi:hypothetical protein
MMHPMRGCGGRLLHLYIREPIIAVMKQNRAKPEVLSHMAQHMLLAGKMSLLSEKPPSPTFNL